MNVVVICVSSSRQRRRRRGQHGRPFLDGDRTKIRLVLLGLFVLLVLSTFYSAWAIMRAVSVLG
jgi:hypothetical protein